MNRYTPSTPRAAFALAAIVLTAMTLGLFIVIPANMDSSFQDARTLDASNTVTPELTVVRDAPTRVERIDVIAVRDTLASIRAPNARRKRKLQQR